MLVSRHPSVPALRRRTAVEALIVLTIAFVLSGTGLQAQWLPLADETGSRLVLSSVPANDGEEKDIAVGDFDRDGDPDIVVARKTPFSNAGPQADLLLMNEGGVLTDRTTTLAAGFVANPTDARDVHVVDVDGDGWLDLFFISTFGDQPRLYMNLGGVASGPVWPGFADESSTRLPTITTNVVKFCAGWSGDVTGNDFPDIYMVNYDGGGQPAEDVLLINDGNGFFTDETVARMGTLRNSSFGTSTELHDLDGDGDVDIIKNTTLGSVPPFNDQGIFVFYNDGTGNFSTWESAPSSSPYMFTVADFDGDEQLDVYVVDDGTDYIDLVTATSVDDVSWNRVDLSGLPRTGGFGGNVKTADLDRDGDIDIGVADVDVDIPPCASSREFSLLRNNTDGGPTMGFNDPYTTDQPWHTNNFDFAFLDVDGDGWQDLFFGRCNGYAVVLQDRILFEDGFESGDTTAWSVSVP